MVTPPQINCETFSSILARILPKISLETPSGAKPALTIYSRPILGTPPRITRGIPPWNTSGIATRIYLGTPPRIPSEIYPKVPSGIVLCIFEEFLQGFL